MLHSSVQRPEHCCSVLEFINQSFQLNTMAENTTKVEGTSESQHSNNAVLAAGAGRHRWEIVVRNNTTKRDRCVKCGLYREWHFGVYNCWYYYTPAYGYGAVEKGSYARPKCGT